MGAASSRLRLLLALLALWPGCTCDGDSSAGAASGAARPRASERTLWLEACIDEPRRVLNDLRALVGASYGGRALPGDPDQLVAFLSGLSTEQLEGSIDWDGPAAVALFEPGRDRPLAEGLALRFRRHVSQRSLTSPTGRRRLDVEGGAFHLEADREHLWASRSAQALDAAVALPASSVCASAGDGIGSVRVRLAPELLASRPVRSWISRKGAWLEATARQGTARYGRSALGDPEAAARALAGWGERTRARVEAAAPLRAAVTITPETLHVEITGSDGDEEPAGGAPPTDGLLGVIAPDAYLVLAGRSGPDRRRETATATAEVIARVAGSRWAAGERRAFEEQARALAGATDGWLTFALRPAREPGPLVAIAALECSDPTAAAAALERLARQLSGPGYFHNAFNHLGVNIEIDEAAAGADSTERGQLSWRVSSRSEAEDPATAPDAGDLRATGPRGLARLLGAHPSLAWRRRDGLLLVAFGPDPSDELQRMTEALDGDAPASVLAQPVLRQATDGGERLDADWLAYGWAPALAVLLTHGGPGAAGLPPGGFAVTKSHRARGLRRTALLLDRAQVRSALRLVAGGRRSR